MLEVQTWMGGSSCKSVTEYVTWLSPQIIFYLFVAVVFSVYSLLFICHCSGIPCQTSGASQKIWHQRLSQRCPYKFRRSEAALSQVKLPRISLKTLDRASFHPPSNCVRCKPLSQAVWDRCTSAVWWSNPNCLANNALGKSCITDVEICTCNIVQR